MDKKSITEALKQARESKQRKFSQSVDFIFNFKDLDLKKPDHQVDLFLVLPKKVDKTRRICAFVDSDMVDEAKKSCDGHVTLDQFPEYASDKKKTKKLASEFTYFIAQATVMPKVATSFGRVLGPKGKMPNPKFGMIFPAKAALGPVIGKLRDTVRVQVKISPIAQVLVGSESMSDDDIADNCLNVYEQIVHALPSEAANIRSMFIKLTMGKAVKLK